MLSVFYRLFVWLLLLGGGWCLPVVHLRNTDNYQSAMYGEPGTLPSLTSMSFCVRTKLQHQIAWFPVLSYGRGEEEMHVRLYMIHQELQFYCCGHPRTRLHFPVQQNVWHHWCLAFSPANATLRLGLNGKVTEENWMVPADVEVITEGGDFAVGQDLIWEDGKVRFGDNRLVTAVADLRLYDRELTADDMTHYMSCSASDHSPAPLLTLDSGHLVPKGLALLANISQEEVCQLPHPNVILFTMKLDFKDAEKWCSQLGGSLPLPEDDQSDEMIHNQLLPSAEACLEDGAGYIYWLGAEGNKTTGKWLNLSSGEPLTWNNFIEHENATSEIKCVGVFTYIGYRYWMPIDCEEKVCVACHFDSSPALSLRGLCTRSVFETTLHTAGYQNGSLLYLGESHTRLGLVEDNWVIQSRIHHAAKATMMSSEEHDTPLGRHEWKVIGDKCSNRKASLVLTVCVKDQFTCNDGTCIDAEKRCNLLLDCPDHSDERHCEVIVHSSDYSPEIPPPSGTSGPLQLNVSMKIASVREFNLKTFTITIDTTLTIFWRDLRLRFKNLQDSALANGLNESLVWFPQTELIDWSLGAVELSHTSRLLYVKQKSEPLSPDDTGTYDNENYMYSGAENNLVMKEKQVITFRCHFGLEMYPFDVQRCSIIIDVHNLHRNFGTMIIEGPGVKFTGQRYLLEYQLVSEVMKPYTINNRTVLQVELRFQNLYGYYIGNVFVPSLMLVMVCYLTLFFTISDFNIISELEVSEVAFTDSIISFHFLARSCSFNKTFTFDRIMVSLTSLLVLAGLFAQTSNSIPKTSYLKLVDVWYLALISIDFFIIVTVVGVEGLQQRHTPFKSTVGPFLLTDHNALSPLAVRINTFAQWIFVAILVVILAVFLGLTQWY